MTIRICLAIADVKKKRSGFVMLRIPRHTGSTRATERDPCIAGTAHCTITTTGSVLDLECTVQVYNPQRSYLQGSRLSENTPAASVGYTVFSHARKT
jgi:hypothetical protein